MEHSDIRLRLEDLRNAATQPEHWGCSFNGTEVLEGDEISIDHDNFDEIILKEHLKQYCIEKLNFIFKGGWVVDKNGFDVIEENRLEEYLHEQYNFEFKIAN
ncbi:YqaI family protein [Neobacillus sp. M.A.Huq-85]